MTSYDMTSRKSSFWPVSIWLVSLICIYEIELRSIVTVHPVDPINLLPSFWLSDFGLLFPIIIALLAGILNSRILSTRVIKYFSASCIYGLILFFLHKNSFSGLGVDLRTCFALFSGLSLVYLMPKDYKTILTLINIISCTIVLIIFIHLMTIPDFSLINYDRITTYSAFTLIGIPLTLIGPIILISVFLEHRLNLIISILTFITLIAMSSIVMQTRSLFIAEIITLMIIIISVRAYHRLVKHKKDHQSITAYIVILVILCSVALVYIFLNQTENVYEFLIRFTFMEEDINYIWRRVEVLQVIERMSFLDLITGMGFNPPSSLITFEKGIFYNYNVLHIGILNVWWRFGFVVFLAWIILFIRLLKKWIFTIRYLRNTIDQLKFYRQKIAFVMCAPGVITVVCMSFLSGGWSIHIFLPLGILLGLYDLIMHEKNILESYTL